MDNLDSEIDEIVGESDKVLTLEDIQRLKDAAEKHGFTPLIIE